ncbi:MAG: tail fiber domain-containing protein [bacterium]|nr:tail fiber domain-containing protein [bacterium]
MTKPKTLFSYAALLLFALSLVGMQGLNAGTRDELAEVITGSNGIYFQPKVSETLQLTVSCPDGYVFKKIFRGGTPHIGLADDTGKYFIDGLYTYELGVIRVNKNQVRDKKRNIYRSSKGITQSGHFTVLGGSIVTADINETGPAASVIQGTPDKGGEADQTILDDLIVNGSLCVGQDCVNGESFGFDTIRLKENNLRIRFQDTSSTSSFPSRDWMITVNDSYNGGANKFSIDDIDGNKTPFTIEASAPSHSIYVDDGGLVGFGTSTPVVDLHVLTGNTPTLRLEQDGSSGFTPQAWDVSGNEANFFIRDATNGSTLPFRIQPGAPSSCLSIMSDGKIGMGTWDPSYPVHILTDSATDATIFAERSGGASAQLSAQDTKVYLGAYTNHKMHLTINNDPKLTIDTDGKVGIGTDSPTFELEVVDPDTDAIFLLERTDGASGYMTATTGMVYIGSLSTDPLKLVVNTEWKLQLNSDESLAMANGASCTTSGIWTDNSSIELKENIRNITSTEAMETLNNLKPVKYNYKVDKDDQCVGFIAEEVPELVAQKDRKSMSAMDVVAVLTKVVQEQQTMAKKQQEMIDTLKNRITQLEKKNK